MFLQICTITGLVKQASLAGSPYYLVYYDTDPN